MPRAAEVVAALGAAWVVAIGGAGSARAQRQHPAPLPPPLPPAPTGPQPGLAESATPPPELPPAEVLSFDAAVEQALAHNPQLLVAVGEIQRAQALLEQVRSGSLPTLSTNVSYTRVEQDRRLPSSATDASGRPIPGAIVVPADQLNANLVLAVPIVAPQRWAQWSHAKDNLSVAKLNEKDVRRQLALTTGRTYLAIIAQRRVVEVAVRARNAARAHYEFAHQRYVGGYGTRVDEVRAAQEVSADESQLQSSVTQLARLRESLGVLVGANHAIDATQDVSLPTPPALDESLHDALSLRSDVRLLRERLRAAQHVEKDNWADYVPALVGSIAPFAQTPATTSVPTYGFQAQLLLSWNIYDGGLRYGLGRERAAVRREAEAGMQGGERQALSDVRTADEEVRRSKAALAAARDAARLAGESMSLVNLAYRAGASTNIEVIDAERVARDADTAVAVAEDAWRQATLDALLASGRFPAR